MVPNLPKLRAHLIDCDPMEGKKAVNTKVAMRLTVFNSEPSSFSSCREFQNATAALLYDPPLPLLVRLLYVCALATSQLPGEAHGSGNIYHIMC